jgi:hypothetical protein
MNFELDMGLTSLAGKREVNYDFAAAMLASVRLPQRERLVFPGGPGVRRYLKLARKCARSARSLSLSP